MQRLPFREDDATGDMLSPYAITKRCGEMLCRLYHKLYGLDIACLRFFTVYGPRGRPDMAPYKFASKILSGEQIERFGDGSSTRDYTYVGDVVKGITAAMERSGFGIYNIERYL
jgi:UDP-glucuronate 4-epimerase